MIEICSSNNVAVLLWKIVVLGMKILANGGNIKVAFLSRAI